jgi:NAD(P)-dependent dehydrogenase (short-subunit alcohol dehydrogenase family)
MAEVNLLGYNSSTSALNAVTVAFAKELAPFGFKVNADCPDYTATTSISTACPAHPSRESRSAFGWRHCHVTDSPPASSTMQASLLGRIAGTGACASRHARILGARRDGS